jgi:hypothetical protein
VAVIFFIITKRKIVNAILYDSRFIHEATWLDLTILIMITYWIN